MSINLLDDKFNYSREGKNISGNLERLLLSIINLLRNTKFNGYDRAILLLERNNYFNKRQF